MTPVREDVAVVETPRGSTADLKEIHYQVSVLGRTCPMCAERGRHDHLCLVYRKSKMWEAHRGGRHGPE